MATCSPAGGIWPPGSGSSRANTPRAAGPPSDGSANAGTRILRQLFIQGAQSSFVHLKRDQSALGAWLRQVEARRHRQVAVVALANKMVRICWKMLTSEEAYQPYPAKVA